MKLFLHFLLTLVLTSASIASELRDGNWWRRQPYAMKLSYVVGVIDGTGAVARLEQFRMTVANYKAHRNNVDALIGNATAGQIVEGLDMLYSDFRNRNIEARSAFWTVTMTIVGAPASTVHSGLDVLRREAAAPAP